MNDDYERMRSRFAASPFRSRFRLTQSERTYIAEKGWDRIRGQARNIILERLAPAFPHNDGRQTPMRAHVVFKAQHATATCCRGCLLKWHHIAPGHELTEQEVDYVVNMIEGWLEDRCGDLSSLPHTPDLF